MYRKLDVKKFDKMFKHGIGTKTDMKTSGTA
jgi:hypothetical protein